MSVMDWLSGVFFPKKFNMEMAIEDVHYSMGYKILAIESAINLISKTISLAEFKTFDKGVEVRKSQYYQFNVNPNNSQNSTEFWRKAVRRLVYYNEVLIIRDSSDNLIIVDSFEREQKSVDSFIYKDIAIGNWTYKSATGNNKIFQEEDVLYISWDNSKMKNIVDLVYKDYVTLIEASRKGYLNNKYMKGILNIDSKVSQQEEELDEIADHYSEQFKKFLDAEGSAIYPLEEGLEWKNVNEDKGKGAVDKHSDTRRFVDDVFDYVAIALNIPPSLLKGDVIDTSDIINDYLTFCIKPIAQIINDELNKKMYSKNEFLERTYVKVDTTMIRVTDLKDIAYAIDVLTRTGSNTIDDNQMILGREPTGDETGKARWITKNLDVAENFFKEGTEDNKVQNVSIDDLYNSINQFNINIEEYKNIARKEERNG